MHVELESCSNFLVHLLRLGRATFTDGQFDKFRHALKEVLRRRYQYHWFPENPYKGSGYRCIRINGKLDPAVAQAAEMAGLPGNAVLRTFPREITLWIDPEEVSYRFGENGSVSVLYDATHSEPWRPNLNAMVNANVHSVDNANANVRRNAQKKTTEEQTNTCKESIRKKMDALLDPRNSINELIPVN